MGLGRKTTSRKQSQEGAIYSVEINYYIKKKERPKNACLIKQLVYNDLNETAKKVNEVH